MKTNILKIVSLLIVLATIFTTNSSSAVLAAQKSDYSKYIYYRGQNLKNTYAKLTKDKQLNVVYFGGSITNGTGATNEEVDSWRGLIGGWLEKQFEEADIKNINSAIGATGSKMGAYRLNHDVIAHKPDLVFVEFSINDHYDDQGEDVPLSEYGMRFETIVRNIRKEFPNCDIISVYTTEISYINLNQAGELHPQAKEHEKICIEYDIPSIHIGRALADEFTVGKVQEERLEYFYNDGINVHPNDKGYKIYFNVIKEYFENCLINSNYDGETKAHPIPRMVNEYLLDGNIQVIDVDETLIAKSNELGGKNFVLKYAPEMASIGNPYQLYGDDGAALQNNEQSAILKFEFTGTEIAILGYCDAISNFSVKIDEEKEKNVSRTMVPIVLATNLEYGKHTITIKPFFDSSVTKKKELWIKAFFVRDQRAQTKKYDHEHKYNVYVSDKNATCKKDGTKTAKCYKAGCDKVNTVVDKGSRRTHKFEPVASKKATLSKNGKGELICAYCGDFRDTVTIYKIKSVKAENCEYNGTARTPSITVKDAKGKTVSSKYYTVKGYGSRKNVGKYKVKVTFKGNYKGSKTVYFNVTPPKYTVQKLTAGKKSLKVTLGNKSKQVKGYELEYSTSKKFTKSTTKKKVVKSYKKTSLTLKGLKSKKTYYVRVRTYKTVKGKKYYSNWSKVAKKKVK